MSKPSLLPDICALCDCGWSLADAAAIWLEMMASEDKDPNHWWVLVEATSGTRH